jgi:CRISPR-associated endonuclease Csn1
MNLSRRAMEKVLPLLERGITYAEARRQLYPEKFEGREPELLLPPVEKVLLEIRNPAVMRSLSELRKVVNAIIRQHGKPAEIHIELARDLRKPKWQRQETSDRMRANEKARKTAAKRILDETGIKEPSPEDVRKVLLAEECHWECPYTGKTISMRKLVGPESEFQIEHIIPFSRSLDNTFVNLTLCHVEENKVKANRTPYEAYGGDPERSIAILDRVKRFSGSRGMIAEKLRRFQMTPEQVEEFLSDFSSRQLTDTAYASKLAKRYLAVLYGGLSDEQHSQRVFASPGRVTGYLRNLWLLNTVLKDGPTSEGGMVPKARTDHRHHAVDAVAIALTSPGTVKQLSHAAQRAPLEHRRRFATICSPWPDFVDSVRDVIDGIVVSHRVSKKVSGGLHKDTVYSPREYGENVRRHRVPLTDLTENQIISEEVIVDPGVRRLVRNQFEALGRGDPKKIFGVAENLPCFRTADGRKIPIKKVRIQETIKTRELGSGPRLRLVKPGGNHHLEIFGQPGSGGLDEKWDTPGVVSMLEAYERLGKRQPIVQEEGEPEWVFRFSVAPGETMAFDSGPLKGSLLVVRTISEEEKTGSVKIEMAPINDARRKQEIKRSGQWITKSPNELRKWLARKVAVSPLGEVSEAHD